MASDNLYFIENAVKEISLRSRIESHLDLGCGHGLIGFHLIPFNFKKSLGVDVDLNSLRFCFYHKLYDRLLQYDFNDLPLPFRDREYDLVTAIEVLEHLDKEKSKLLLDEMERIGKWVVVSTPTIFFSNQPTVESSGNTQQLHRCSWSMREFRERGYKVRGCGNMQFFGHEIKYVSFVLRGFSNIVPELSTQIVAWKESG